MSNSLAIAAVTATLRRRLLNAGIGFVTTLPPDLAAADAHAERVNLFLYDLQHSAAWRNRDMPGQVSLSETGFPPLALNLYFLLTAYGDATPSLLDNRLLGRAMLAMHDAAILSPDDIQEASLDIRDEAVGDVDLHRQLERVRISPHGLSVEDKSRLWGTFQTQYRVSVAYEASVVLIDSSRQRRTALPVASRGERDRGWVAQPSLGAILDQIEYRDVLIPGAAPLKSASFPTPNEAPRVVSMSGRDIVLVPPADCALLIRNPRIAGEDGIVVRLQPLESGPAGQVRFAVDPQAGGARWVSGLLTIAVESGRTTSHSKTSNALPFALAPRLQLNPVQQVLAIPSSENERDLLTVSCAPPLATNDGVVLILDEVVDPTRPPTDRKAISRQLPLVRDSVSHTPTTPTFDGTGLPPGRYWVRLRIDGIDSHLVSVSGTSRTLDQTQQLTWN